MPPLTVMFFGFFYILVSGQTCGERFVPKISGGTPAITAWPWMVHIQGASDNRPLCGGTIVAAKWVLTTGGCV